MKKLFTVLSVMALGFTSCGEANGDEEKAEGSSQKAISSAVCDCIDSRLNMMKDVIRTGMSEEDVFTKYANEMEPCLAMVDNKLSDDIYKEAENCASIEEYKKIEKELKKKMRSEEMKVQRLEFPKHSYHKEKGAAPFQFNISDYSTLKTPVNCNEYYCEQEIYLGKGFNGSINLFYKKVDHPDSIRRLINFSNEEVDFHKMKASDIAYNQIIDNESKVYGTLFELKGDVATNFQFYLTDSTQNFVRGELVLNCVPKYDSLKHVLGYLKEDLTEMINTFEWHQD